MLTVLLLELYIYMSNNKSCRVATQFIFRFFTRLNLSFLSFFFLLFFDLTNMSVTYTSYDQPSNISFRFPINNSNIRIYCHAIMTFFYLSCYLSCLDLLIIIEWLFYYIYIILRVKINICLGKKCVWKILLFQSRIRVVTNDVTEARKKRIIVVINLKYKSWNLFSVVRCFIFFPNV